MIYFIQQGIAGPIKIGKTEFVPTRMNDLQCANPETLRLVGLQDSDDYIERMLHDKFSKDRIRGEWFNPSPVIVNYINELNTLEDTTEAPCVGNDYPQDYETETLRLMEEQKTLRADCKQLKTGKDTYGNVGPYITELESQIIQLKDEVRTLKFKLRNYTPIEPATPIFTNRKFQGQAVG